MIDVSSQLPRQRDPLSFKMHNSGNPLHPRDASLKPPRGGGRIQRHPREGGIQRDPQKGRVQRHPRYQKISQCFLGVKAFRRFGGTWRPRIVRCGSLTPHCIPGRPLCRHGLACTIELLFGVEVVATTLAGVLRCSSRQVNPLRIALTFFWGKSIWNVCGIISAVQHKNCTHIFGTTYLELVWERFMRWREG